MLQTADALVIVVDREGRIVRFNPKCAAASGYREEEAYSRHILGRSCCRIALCRPRLRGLRPDGRDRTERPAPAVPTELPLRTRTGGERLIAWRQSLVRDEEGRVSYVIGVGLDVTEQRRLEDHLRRDAKAGDAGDPGGRHRPRLQ